MRALGGHRRERRRGCGACLKLNVLAAGTQQRRLFSSALFPRLFSAALLDEFFYRVYCELHRGIDNSKSALILEVIRSIVSPIFSHQTGSSGALLHHDSVRSFGPTREQGD